jgi:hypothetical protein
VRHEVSSDRVLFIAKLKAGRQSPRRAPPGSFHARHGECREAVLKLLRLLIVLVLLGLPGAILSPASAGTRLIDE